MTTEIAPSQVRLSLTTLLRDGTINIDGTAVLPQSANSADDKSRAALDIFLGYVDIPGLTLERLAMVALFAKE